MSQELEFFDIFGNQLDLTMATVFCVPWKSVVLSWNGKTCLGKGC